LQEAQAFVRRLKRLSLILPVPFLISPLSAALPALSRNADVGVEYKRVAFQCGTNKPPFNPEHYAFFEKS